MADAREGLMWSMQAEGPVAYRKRDAAWVGVVRERADGTFVVQAAAGLEAQPMGFNKAGSAMAYLAALYEENNGAGLSLAVAPAPWGTGPELPAV